MSPSSFFTKDDFRVETWLLAGGCLQAILYVAVGNSASLLTAIYALYQVGKYLRHEQSFIEKEDPLDKAYKGKWSAQLPHAGENSIPGTGEQQIVVFVLGARSNHPRGRFSPGYKEMDQYFQGMWKDVIANRTKNGFLGKTPTLQATDRTSSNATYWISYWKDPESLQAFAQGAAHSKGLRWYITTAAKNYAHIGLYHETYNVPKGNWENIMLNCEPMGIATTKHFVPDQESGGLTGVDIIVPATRGLAWHKMADRMNTSVTET